MQAIAFFFLALNVLFFILLTICSVARYTIYKGIWSSMIHHPVQSLYLGCYPMGFATIIISSTAVVYDYFGYGGPPFLYALWGLWWADVVVALVTCFGQLHVMCVAHGILFLYYAPVEFVLNAGSRGKLMRQPQ